jgi:hypothetical protein
MVLKAEDRAGLQAPAELELATNGSSLHGRILAAVFFTPSAEVASIESERVGRESSDSPALEISEKSGKPQKTYHCELKLRQRRYVAGRRAGKTKLQAALDEATTRENVVSQFKTGLNRVFVHYGVLPVSLFDWG